MVVMLVVMVEDRVLMLDPRYIESECLNFSKNKDVFFLLVIEVIVIEDFQEELDSFEVDWKIDAKNYPPRTKNVLLLILCLVNILNYRQDPLVIMILVDSYCSMNLIVVVTEEHSILLY